MKLKVSVPEVVELFNEIQEKPERLYQMICFDVRETVGEYRNHSSSCGPGCYRRWLPSCSEPAAWHKESSIARRAFFKDHKYRQIMPEVTAVPTFIKTDSVTC